MPKKKVVSPPIPSDLLPVVDTLIRRAVPCLESFVPTPVCLEDAITEALHRYARDQGTGRMTAQEMRARTRPVPEVANIPSYVSYQLCQRLYRHVANASGKMLAVPELLGFADLAVEVERHPNGSQSPMTRSLKNTWLAWPQACRPTTGFRALTNMPPQPCLRR